jgi:hypothetical protein
MTAIEPNPQSTTPMNREHATEVGVRNPQSSAEVVVSVRGLAGVAN